MRTYEMTTKMNGYRTPEMIANSISKYGHYYGCVKLNQFLNKYYIYDYGTDKIGVEVTFLNGKAVATRNVPVKCFDALISPSAMDIKFGDF